MLWIKYVFLEEFKKAIIIKLYYKINRNYNFKK